MKENVTISNNKNNNNNNVNTENSKHVILRGKLEDVRGYVGEVSIDLDSLSHDSITGFVEISIVSDETPTIFNGKITGTREKDKIRISYQSQSSDNPIAFNYEGNLVELGKGVGITGSYKVAAETRNTFLKAGVLTLIETQGLPAAQQSMSMTDSSDQDRANIENPFKISRAKP
jgi:hypothetical protein